MDASRAVLAINAGSSSLKFALYELRSGAEIAPVCHGELEEIDTTPHFVAHDAKGTSLADTKWSSGQEYEKLLADLLGWIDQHLGDDKLVAVGHRVVHGGRDFVDPVRLTDDVVAALDQLTPLAPLHQPHSLSPVRAIMKLRPGLPQIACFDTAFHHTLPPVATRFALPRSYEDEGVRRYGFHGLSYEYIARRLRGIAPHLARGRIIVAHLGNGASLCAMQDGRSVDTTMGFTALDGLVMGTRCGTIDAGCAALHAAAETPVAARGRATAVQAIRPARRLRPVKRHADIARQRQAARARGGRAVRVPHRARNRRPRGIRSAASTASSSPPASASTRRKSARRCANVCAGSVLCRPPPRRHPAPRISAPDSRVEVHVLATDEEAMIAEHTLAVLTAGSTSPQA